MELKARVVVPGERCGGQVFSAPDTPVKGGVFVTKTLDLEHYLCVVKAVGVVCEVCEPSSHIAVICRILGIPVFVVENPLQRFVAGDFVLLDSAAAFVKKGGALKNQPVQLESSVLDLIRHKELNFQVSIVLLPELIEQANAKKRGDIEQFFIRAEFVWIAKNHHPFEFLENNGPNAVTDLLVQSLVPLLECIEPWQSLNVRSLDIRSDQWKQFGKGMSTETNPELGLHGIRQLLVKQEFLVAELMAIDHLYEMGYTNVIFSLPFLTLESELNSVLDLRDQYCKNKIKVGIFIETPAAVFELPYFLLHDLASLYIGTKDLTQLILAADRGNPQVAHIYKATRRPVVEAVNMVVEKCDLANTPVFVFAFLHDLDFLLKAVPGLSRISITASEYKNFPSKD